MSDLGKRLADLIEAEKKVVPFRRIQIDRAKSTIVGMSMWSDDIFTIEQGDIQIEMSRKVAQKVGRGLTALAGNPPLPTDSLAQASFNYFNSISDMEIEASEKYPDDANLISAIKNGDFSWESCGYREKRNHILHADFIIETCKQAAKAVIEDGPQAMIAAIDKLLSIKD